MANWRKQQGESHHQVGHWRHFSSYNRKPPLDNRLLTVPSWEKKFCASVGSVPWRKLIETKKYMYLHDNVVKWDDSAGKEAFHNAKRRFWAEINGLPCDISLPDPNLYIDDVDWSLRVDPELILDLEREAKVHGEEERDEEVVILNSSLLLNQSFSCTGWGDAEEDIAKPTDPTSATQGWESNIPNPTDPILAAQGWESNLPEYNGLNSWEQSFVPFENGYEWKNYPNDSWGWNQRHQTNHGGDLHKIGKGRAGGNWGTWDGYNRKRENMSWRPKTTADHGENIPWQKTSAAYHGDQYQMNRGRRNNNRGRKREDFAYDRPHMDKIPAAVHGK